MLKEFFGKQKNYEQPSLLRSRGSRPSDWPTKTKPDTERAPASVNREFELLSRIFTLAIDEGRPTLIHVPECKNSSWTMSGIRYLDPSEETALMAALVSRRAHLHSMVSAENSVHKLATTNWGEPLR
jgi:hypothetical protein